MNKRDIVLRLDRLLDELETEILAAPGADVLAGLADSGLADRGRAGTAMLHEVRALINGRGGLLTQSAGDQCGKAPTAPSKAVRLADPARP